MCKCIPVRLLVCPSVCLCDVAGVPLRCYHPNRCRCFALFFKSWLLWGGRKRCSNTALCACIVFYVLWAVQWVLSSEFYALCTVLCDVSRVLCSVHCALYSSVSHDSRSCIVCVCPVYALCVQLEGWMGGSVNLSAACEVMKSLVRCMFCIECVCCTWRMCCICAAAVCVLQCFFNGKCLHVIYDPYWHVCCKSVVLMCDVL